MPPRAVGPGADGDAVGNAVEPGPDAVAVADDRSAADQDEEGGLEGILDVVLVAEEPAADAQDHRSVPGHERSQGRLVAAGDEPLEERGLAQAGNGPAAEDPVQLAQDSLRVSAHDDPAPVPENGR